MEDFKYLHGDAYEKLKELPDNSVDSIVTDPPYGLGNPPDAYEVMKDWVEKGYHDIKGKGFMGKDWDAFVPQPRVWKECLRVLKPGGHLLAFSGTRTQDWMGMSLRFGGFEIRDSIAWAYGCLSEDTEILTNTGWVQYNKINNKKLFHENILIYDNEKDTYKWEIPSKWYEYKIKDIAYRIQSDYTDQIVSRNHRCLVEREGKLVFIKAETLERKENIPILEGLQDLPETISNTYEGTSVTKYDLLSRMQECNIEKPQETSDNAFSPGNLPSLWKRISDKKKQTFKILLEKMQWKSKGSKIEKTRAQRQVGMVGRNKRKISNEPNGRKQSCLERRFNIHETQRKVCESVNQICKVSTGVYTNGSERRICNGASVDCGNGNKQTIDTGRVRTPHKSQCGGQQDRKFDTIQNKCRPQKIRTWASYKTTLATVEPIEYSGIIFCPTVSTGAFVARRNGKVFLTGNSGFPKSHNIGKAVDKLQGNKREVVGKYKHPDGGSRENSKANNTGNCYQRDGREWEKELTKGTSEYEGWGTALKPALEPIIVARKPLSEKTVAENVLKWGTGGINIDESRIGTDEEIKTSRPENNNNPSGWKETNRNTIYKQHSQGRYPANIIHDGSDQVLELFPNTKSGKMTESHTRHTDGSPNGIYGKFDANYKLSETYGDTGSAARFFYCAKASQFERNFGLEDEDEVTVGDGRKKEIDNPFQRGKTIRKNFHTTVKPIRLMIYLTRLVTPKGGTVLDPFAGSGSTGIACKENNFGFIAIDNELDYIYLLKKRIKNWVVGILDKDKKDVKKMPKKDNNNVNKFF